MPVYEFRCLDCRKQFSLTLSVAERARAQLLCPKCEGRRVEQKFTSVQAATSKKG